MYFLSIMLQKEKKKKLRKREKGLQQIRNYVHRQKLTGDHSPVTGSGRSLPPLGAIHII